MGTVLVYLNDGSKRRTVSADLIKRNAKTIWVRLPGGRVIQRRIRRDVAGGLP